MLTSGHGCRGTARKRLHVHSVQSSQLTSAVNRKSSWSLLLAFFNQTGYTETKPDVNLSLFLMVQVSVWNSVWSNHWPLHSNRSSDNSKRQKKCGHSVYTSAVNVGDRNYLMSVITDRLYGLVVRVVIWTTDPEVLVRFSALPDFLRSSRSGTGSIQPREDNWGDISRKYWLRPRKPRLTAMGVHCADHATFSIR
jgi:hypothetical protein